MRKILCLILLLGLLASTPALAQENKVIKCKLPAGTPFAMVFNGQMTLVGLAEETTVTIIDIEREVPAPSRKDLPPRDIGTFSVSYDKPGLLCRTHGIDPYETYKDNLTMDKAFIFLDMCIED